MIDLELIEAVLHDAPHLIFAVPVLIGALLLGYGHLHRKHKKREAAIAEEMRRLLKVYVTAGDWTPKDTVIGRQASAALKARVIIK